MARRTVIGRWRILEMELWDREAMDLVEPAVIEFARDGTGNFHFIVVDADLGWRPRTGVTEPGRRLRS